MFEVSLLNPGASIILGAFWLNFGPKDEMATQLATRLDMERSGAPTTMGNLDNLHREELLRLMEEVARKLGVSAPLGQGTFTE